MRKQETCYRCHLPFPTKAVIQYGAGKAVIKHEPDTYAAQIWGIPNNLLTVAVCKHCRHIHDEPKALEQIA